jgi:hypothetical protein
MEWKTCQKLPKHGTQNFPNTYKTNPELNTTESFEVFLNMFKTCLQEIDQLQ